MVICPYDSLICILCLNNYFCVGNLKHRLTQYSKTDYTDQTGLKVNIALTASAS